jgi:NAD(P)-dependent dehydrogenase (short-subunit alcohol dehydrogenase family)
VVVVGGSRGLGAAMVLELLARGHVVHAVYSTSTEAAAELERGAGQLAERLSLHRADAGDPAMLEPLAEAIAGRGIPLRGLVLSAAPPPLGMSLTAASATTSRTASASRRCRLERCSRRSGLTADG